MVDCPHDGPVEGSPAGDARRLIALERLDHLLFRTRFSALDYNDHLFGGQVLAQALAAATATVDERRAHSLHGYFLRAGSARQRMVLQVERTRDGGRFSTRRVVAMQKGVPIFHMDCSFHDEEAGLTHEARMIDAPPPEGLPTLAQTADLLAGRIPDHLAERLRHPRLIEMRLVDHEQLLRPDASARRRFWLRVPSAGDDPRDHAPLVAYLSDFWLASSMLVPHTIRSAGPELFVASLDHALWMHAPHRADEWLLYDCHSPWSGGGRGLAHGMLHDRGGRLIASVVQEALLRMRSGPHP